MCAIAGLWNFEPKGLRDQLKKMVLTQRHRGPDAEGYLIGETWGLGHSRLSIVDVTGGGQPIRNGISTFAIVGNNEIYNAPQLRAELQELGHHFKTRSDTEVILHGFIQWGPSVFRKLNGMFAVAIIDEGRKRCVLARDPLGIKPLHYAVKGKSIAFSSEVKGLREVPGLGANPNWDALHLFLNLRYVPNNQTLFDGVFRLPPGTYAELSQDGMQIRQYYSWESVCTPARACSRADAVDVVADLLPKAVDRHLISDVEVGAYLSGGIDSSIVSLLAHRTAPGLRTFCFGFGEPTDENRAAASFANLLGAKHTDYQMPASALDRFSEILWHVEEPKVNCLQGYLLAEKVSAQVKVVLSGLGGDELFAGYVNHDLLTPTVWASRLKNGKTRSFSFLQKHFRPQNDTRFRALELGLNVFDPLSYYLILRNTFDHNAYLMRSLYAKPPSHWNGLTYEAVQPYFHRENPDVFNELLLLEMRTKLVNDFLLTEDRVSMAHGLEVRVPFLDRELVEAVVALPSRLKYRAGQKKRLLKQVARDWLPSETLSAPKWGFSVTPHSFYDRGLKDFLQRVLTPENVGKLGLYSWPWINRVLEAKPSSRLRWHYFNLWVMAGVTLWHQTFFEGKSRAAVRTAA